MDLCGSWSVIPTSYANTAMSLAALAHLTQVDRSRKQCDPLKAVYTALVGSAGVASLLMTSEACIVDAEKEKKPADGMSGMSGFREAADPFGSAASNF